MKNTIAARNQQTTQQMPAELLANSVNQSNKNQKKAAKVSESRGHSQDLGQNEPMISSILD